MRENRDPAITAYALCNCLGLTTKEVIATLAGSRTGLGPPPFPLTFETVCGAVRGDLEAPPAPLSSYDCHQARIALHTLPVVQ